MRTLFSLLLLVVLSPCVASAADPWIGKRVFIKEGAVGKLGNLEVDRALIGFPATVGDAKGDLLWFDRAWFQQRDVMSPQEAAGYYTERVQREPTVRAWWNNRASVWNEQGEFDKAIEDYTTAIRLDPKYAAAYTNRGVAWKNKGDFKRAIENYDEAIKLDPNSAGAYLNRGMAWKDQGEFDNAIRDFTKSLQLDPQEAMAYDGRGSVWKEQGKLDRAMEDFSQAIKQNPKFADAYYHRGVAELSNQEIEKAIQDFTQTIKLEPQNYRAYSARGMAWTDKPDFANAVQDFNEAIRIAPKDSLAYNALARLRATAADARFRDGKQGAELAIKACALTEWKKWNFLDTLAAALAEMGDFEHAIQVQEKLLDMVPESSKPFAVQRLELYKSGKPYRELPK